MPTFRPRSRRPSARLTAVVDLPTPPLPDATAMMAPTPGTPTVPWARCAAAAAAGEVAPGCGRAEPAERSAVSATMTEATPGNALTTASARLRTGSQAFTTAPSTVMEKNTFPSETTMSDRAPVLGKARPSGLATRSRLARTSLLVNAIKASMTTAGQTPRGRNFYTQIGTGRHGQRNATPG